MASLLARAVKAYEDALTVRTKADPAHHTRYGAWSSIRHASGQWLPSLDPPFCPGAMVMRPDNGGVHHDIFKVRITSQSLEKPLLNAFLRPAVEALEHAVPVPKLRRQLPPVTARARNPENSVNKLPVVSCRPTSIALLARQQILDPLPLIRPKLPSRHPYWPPIPANSLNQKNRPLEILKVNKT